ncbi:MAG TPA: hypothetical protein VG755_30120, partial [Nannocystaceae bacterium]|nr:hypothetical protein [Nannocystaceae bacterium]
MRLLELWERLEAGERSIEMLPPLRRLATLSMAERGPWLSAAIALAKAEAPELRAAAIALFDGTTAVPGLRHVVDALDDDDEMVRAAAIAALASACVAAPARWAHAIFHARVEVRRAAVPLTPEPARWMLAWARADPQLAELVQGAPWPADALPLLCDLWRLRAVAANDAAAALTAVTVEQLRAHLTLANRRDVGEVARFLVAAEKSATPPKIVSDDALDPLLEILVAAGDAGRAAWGGLRDAIVDPATPELRPRATLSACAVAGRMGWCEPLAQLALIGHAQFLAFPFVPAAMRRAATQVIWARRDALASLPRALVTALLASELVRDEAGAIDLVAAAPVVALLESQRLELLVEAFGEAALHERVHTQPGAWDAVCRLPLEPDHLLWLEQLAHADAELHARASAIAVKRWIGGDPEHVAAATIALEAAPIATSVVLLRDDGEELSSHETTAALVRVMLAAVAVADLPLVLAAAAAGPHDRALPRAVLASLLANNSADVVDHLVSNASAETRTQTLAWIRDVLVPDPALLEALAQRWHTRDDAELRAFAARILRPSAPAPAPRSVVSAIQRLPSAVAERIASCDEAELADAVAPAMSAPCFGLTDALARRARPPAPNLAVCAALLACVDGLAPVARELARFGADDAAFDEAMLHAALALWKNAEAVPPLVDATLIAFDRSALGFAVWLDAEEGGHFGALRFLLGLPSGWTRRITWHAVSQVLSGWTWCGEHRRVARGLTEETLPMLIGMLDTELGESAARIIVALFRGHLVDSELARMRPRVLALAPACTRETLHVLSGWLPLAGITPRGAPSRRVRAALPADERSETRASRDIGHLAQLCRIAGEATVREAVARLIELGV